MVVVVLVSVCQQILHLTQVFFHVFQLFKKVREKQTQSQDSQNNCSESALLEGLIVSTLAMQARHCVGSECMGGAACPREILPLPKKYQAFYMLAPVQTILSQLFCGKEHYVGFFMFIRPVCILLRRYYLTLLRYSGGMTFVGGEIETILTIRKCHQLLLQYACSSDRTEQNPGNLTADSSEISFSLLEVASRFPYREIRVWFACLETGR